MRRPGGRPLSFKEWTKRFGNEQGEFIGSKVVDALNEGGRGRDAAIKFCAHYGIGLPAKQRGPDGPPV